MWEFLDKVVYINLDHRTDRLDIINKFLEIGDFPPKKVLRFSAIKQYPGTVGCAKSHIAILKMAIENNWNNVLILEDDIEWTGDFQTSYSQIRKLVTSNNDVVLLGGGYNCVIDRNRPLFSYCTSSYIVNKHYYKRLLSNFEAGLIKLTGNKDMNVILGSEDRIKNDHINEIDTFWSRLMRMDKWRAVIPSCVRQITGYSDVVDTIRIW